MFISPHQYFRLQESRPRKRFGQNFLAQPATAERIVECAGIAPDDVAVEIGPGLGALTQFILTKARRLHLIEIDRDLAAYLEANAPAGPCEIRMHPQDVMRFDFRSLAEEEGQRLILLGNLPYNISSPLLFHLVEALPAIRRGVFMVQKEVGERFAAPPGGKEYGVLSVLLGVCAHAELLFDVGPAQFYPAPKVDSTVLRIDFAEALPPGAPDLSFLRKIVNTAFQQRRKTLRNSLKALGGVELALLDRAFSELGIDPGRRPETLSPEEFMNLAKLLKPCKSRSE
jgi:16S rRNA (adenine1518-N6/adenine1519-N6)-dimethyltransferase